MRMARRPQSAAIAFVAILLSLPVAHAGGPQYVAGVSYFDPAVKGQPLVWPQNTVTYYTDAGDLSPLLPQASADALVADSFAQWTNIATVALVATRGGPLAEDVNGSNVTVAAGELSLPADIQPSAANAPVGIVYDLDGQVTETLLGMGSSNDCRNNAAYGGLDNFGSDATLAHALVILNGICAQESSQLVDFEYHVVRVLGRVLGLGASQANLNVWTGRPVPTAADFAGFPVMHAIDLASCQDITACLPNPLQPTMDDRAALGRLYPVTDAYLANFPNKTSFAASTARVHGTVSFPGTDGPGQGMQGVNVVARWIDPATLQPSRTYVASCVSGHLYRGNAGNPVTGGSDASGRPYDQWGSDDPALQGFFDLAGLEIPNGFTTANFQLTFERVDPLYSEAVGSYAPLQVDPSGISPALVVTVPLGGDTEQDVVMAGATVVPATPLISQDYSIPVAVPGGGEWMSWLASAGGTNYYSFPAQANRTLSVEVATVDEQGNATQNKAQPVIGIWSMDAPEGTAPPAFTPNPFDTTLPGLTRLDAQVLTGSNFRIGITDWRGDGRPDYAHHVRVLYADSISPARVGAAGGGALQVLGTGFRPAMAAQVGGVPTSVVDFGANQLVIQTPAIPDGIQTVIVSDPATGGFSTMTDAITVGAGPFDAIQLLPVPNPAIPVGGKTPSPLQFLVTDPDGIPVPGASVLLGTSNRMTLDPCGGATTCSVFSNESGRVLVNVGITLPGPGLVIAELAPSSYPFPSTAVATLTGIASNLDIALLGQLVEVEQGTTVDVPLLARVIGPTGPQPGVAVNFQVAVGTGALRAASVISDANGNALDTLHLAPVTTDVQVSACIAPTNNPCKTFTVSSVPVAALQIEAVSGTQQVITEGQPVAPVIMRVTDNSSPPLPVFGATVIFLNQLSRSGSGGAPVSVDDVVGNPNPDPVVLGAATTIVASNNAGLASTAPWGVPLTAGEQVTGLATVDSGAQVAFSLQVIAAPPSGTPGPPAQRQATASVVPIAVRSARSSAALPVIFGPVFSGFFGSSIPVFDDLSSLANAPQTADDKGVIPDAGFVGTPMESAGESDDANGPLQPREVPTAAAPKPSEQSPKSPCEQCAGGACAEASRDH